MMLTSMMAMLRAFLAVSILSSAQQPAQAQAQASASSTVSSATRGTSTSPSLSPLAFASLAKRQPNSAWSRGFAKKSIPFLHNKCPPRALSLSLPSNGCHHHRSQKLTQLNAAIDDNDNIKQQETSIFLERLELNQQFERWRFLQQLLEAELPPSDIENVLLLALHAYLQHGPNAMSSNNKNDNGGNASPVLTEQQRKDMEGLIANVESVSDGIGDSRFLHMLVLPIVDYESTDIDIDYETIPLEDKMVKVDSDALSILQQIEQLLPDMVEDEEAFKSAWDVVIDLYGRESVKVREEKLQREKESESGGFVTRSSGGGDNGSVCAENLEWRTLCAVGRVLIHFDFLTKGVLKEGTFR